MNVFYTHRTSKINNGSCLSCNKLLTINCPQIKLRYIALCTFPIEQKLVNLKRKSITLNEFLFIIGCARAGIIDTHLYNTRIISNVRKMYYIHSVGYTLCEQSTSLS